MVTTCVMSDGAACVTNSHAMKTSEHTGIVTGSGTTCNVLLWLQKGQTTICKDRCSLKQKEILLSWSDYLMLCCTWHPEICLSEVKQKS